MTNLDALWMDRVVVKTVTELGNRFKANRITEYMPFIQPEMEKGVRFILLFLRESLLFGKPEIFFDNVAWFRQNHLNQSLPPFVLEETLGLLKAIITEEGSTSFWRRANPIMDEALEHMAEGMPVRETYLDQPGVDMAGCGRYLDALLSFDPEGAREVVRTMLQEGPDARKVYSRLIQPVLYETGRLWHTGTISVAQEHYVTEATRSIMASILPSAGHAPESGRTFVGLCVENEQHSVGIQIVCDLFAFGGWQSHYLGSNVPCPGILDLLTRKEVDIIGISVAMPYNIHKAAEVIECIRSLSGIRQPGILVGGVAFNEYPDLWMKVGADGYTRTAEEAFEMGTRLAASQPDAVRRAHEEA